MCRLEQQTERTRFDQIVELIQISLSCVRVDNSGADDPGLQRILQRDRELSECQSFLFDEDAGLGESEPVIDELANRIEHLAPDQNSRLAAHRAEQDLGPSLVSQDSFQKMGFFEDSPCRLTGKLL